MVETINDDSGLLTRIREMLDEQAVNGTPAEELLLAKIDSESANRAKYLGQIEDELARYYCPTIRKCVETRIPSRNLSVISVGVLVQELRGNGWRTFVHTYNRHVDPRQDYVLEISVMDDKTDKGYATTRTQVKSES